MQIFDELYICKHRFSWYNERNFYVMKWLDIEDIVEALEEKFPNEDIISIGFTELKRKILGLENFDDDQNRCNEKILEAIQAAWLEERLST